MAWTTIGDLSHTYLLGHHGARLRATSQSLQVELTTGQASDTSAHVAGEYTHLADIERNLTMLDSYRTAISEATLFADTMQTALQTIQETSSSLGSSLLLVGQSQSETNLDIAAGEARTAFEALVGTLNVQLADRSLFAGADHDQAALADSETILSALRAALAGETTLTGIEAQLDNWFDTPGGGFESVAYGGASQDGAGFQLSEGTRLTPSVRADDTVFRELLKTTAIAALSGDDTLAFSSAVRSAMIQSSGNQLLSLQTSIVDVQAEVGVIQSMIEDNAARNEAATTAMSMARNELLAVDPFEAASRLEQVQTQIETMYAVTARSRQLSFLEFMR